MAMHRRMPAEPTPPELITSSVKALVSAVWGTSRSISRILSRPFPTGAIIHLRPLLPAAWCDLPGGSGEQPSSASADACASF
jgi:hypothetical protein